MFSLTLKTKITLMVSALLALLLSANTLLVLAAVRRSLQSSSAAQQAIFTCGQLLRIAAAQVAVLIVAIILVRLMTRRLMAPLGSFTSKLMAIFAEEAEPQPERVEKGDEIAALAMACNRFLEQISERKQAAERAKETLSLLHATIESTADGIAVRDLAGRISIYNRKFAEMWGLPEDCLASLDDRKLRLFVLDQVRYPDSFFEMTERTYRDPELESADIVELKDGRVFERVAMPQRVDKRVVGRVLSYRDVTERERAQEEIRENAERYRSLVDNIDLGIILIDPDHRVVMANKWAADKLSRKPAEKIVQTYCFEEFEKRPAICGHCPGVRAMESGRPASVETTGYRDDGSSIQVRVQAFPIPGRDGRPGGFIEVVQDITEQRAAEAERKLLEEQLRQSHKMEALGTMAGGIAHDFNNILTAITAYCSLIERKIPQDSGIRQYLEKLTFSTERASALTQSLLAYSRKHPINQQTVDLNEAVSKVVHLLSRLLGEDIELAVDPGEGPYKVRADGPQLGQVLMNLAANARDAMPEGGVLRISTGCIEIDDRFIKGHGYGQPGSYAVLTVSDTGTGIDPQTRQRIFEPFFTTKEAGKGTGLGLAVAYGIVKQHNGYIDVSSEPGEGTNFTVYLPLAKCPDAALPSLHSAPVKKGSETILLVEDDPEIRTTLKEVLELEGYTVIDAIDGDDGIEQFRRHADEIQMLLLDVVMPKKNGRVVYEEIRGLRPEMRALFISGYTADILDAKGVGREQYNFLSKPISVDNLLLKLREVLEMEMEAA